MPIFTTTTKPQFMHGPGCSCEVCAAPSTMKSVLASSVMGEANSDSRGRGGAFRIPSWIFPSTSAERKGEIADVEKGGQEEVSGTAASNKLDLDAILEGRTRSPVSLDDLKAFLRTSNNREPLGELAALDFLMEFNRYKAAFFALHPSQQAPDPATVLQQLSTVGIDPRPPVPPKDPQYSPVVFTTPRGRGAAPIESIFPAQPGRVVLPNGVIRPATSTSTSTTQSGHRSRGSDLDTLPLLVIDPSAQPLRAELQRIVDSYLSGIASAILMTIVPPDAVALALSETELTTHPSTLLPVANALTAHFNDGVLPFFFRDAVVNLSKTTSNGRLLMAVLIFVVAMAVSAVFIVLKGTFPRWSRLALMPLYLASVGYAIGSQTGLCFWLAWRGTREAKEYEEEEEEEKAIAAERRFRRSSTMSGSVESTSKALSDDSHRNGCQSIYTINATSLAEKGWRTSGEHERPRAVLSRKEWLIRMTGTATSTVPVEDHFVRKAQVKIAAQVTLLLFVSTAAIMTVVVAIP